MQKAWIAIFVATIANSAAVAQTPAPSGPSAGPAAGPSAGPSQCATPDSPANNLSDKLSQSKGVICPPSGVDPKMAAPPPSGGNTPVIPPPGTPGGDQNVQPK
jgi:hypothetical protein